jgi:hypothetical protein
MSGDRLATLLDAVGSPANMSLSQAESLYARTTAFQPDLIVELGRGLGNSTAVFTQYAKDSGCETVISVGYETGWATSTVPKLEQIVPKEWFSPLTVISWDIISVDYRPIFAAHTRPLVFWDAHGRAVARTVMREIVPLLPAEHLVIVHDISPSATTPKSRYRAGPFACEFSEVKPLWKMLRHGFSWEFGDGWIAFRR